MFQEFLQCRTLDEWSQLLFKAAGKLGFSSVLFGIKPTISSPFTASVIISNYSRSWREAYDSGGYHEVDPVVFHCLNSSVPLLWTENNFHTRPEQELYEEARAHNVRSGLCMPIHGPSGEFGMLNFLCDESATADALHPERLGALVLMRDYAMQSYIHLRSSADELDVPPKLTARELECLKWVAAGKTSWEISRILSCAEVTVNYHVSNFMRKFNAESRQHAVIRGIRSGLVMP